MDRRGLAAHRFTVGSERGEARSEVGYNLGHGAGLRDPQLGCSAKVDSRKGVYVLVAVATFGVLLILAYLFPTAIYRCQDEVDIRTGRIRHSQYILFVRTGRRIEASPLSKVLPAGMEDRVKPDWRLVNRFAMLSYSSPHYEYHDAPGQMNHLAMLWQRVPFTEDAKQQVALTVLQCWQSGGCDSGAERYIFMAHMTAERIYRSSGQPITAAQLPRAGFSWR